MLHRRRLLALLLPVSLCFSVPTQAAEAESPVAAWRGAKVRPVSSVAGRHTMHTYYLVNPESPDGTKVVFYASTDEAGHVGNVVVQDRATGEETVVAANVQTEDAHRAALQQWLSGGKLVAYHEVVDGRWQVCVVDVATKQKTVVAQDRQLAFAQAHGDLLPMYGCHWNPGDYRDLYLWDARTGQTTVPVKIGDVEALYGDWLKEEFAGKQTSIAFPALSPNLNRIFFKMAAGNGGDVFRAKGVSVRQGTVFYDLRKKRITWQRNKWGHPAWHPDSQHIIEMGNFIFDADGGPETQITKVPVLRGMHPSVAPDGKYWITDGIADRVGGSESEWVVMIADFAGDAYEVLYSSKLVPGAASWRVSHPHPICSADGRRIYFNAGNGTHTTLYVAEKP